MTQPGQRRAYGRRTMRRQLRQREALDLYLQGLSTPQVGKRMGISGSYAYRLIQGALAQAAQDEQGMAKVALQRQLLQLQQAMREAWAIVAKPCHHCTGAGTVPRALALEERADLLQQLMEEKESGGDTSKYDIPVVPVTEEVPCRHCEAGFHYPAEIRLRAIARYETVADAMAKLLGLYAPELHKVEVHSWREELAALPDEEIDTMYNQYVAGYTARLEDEAAGVGNHLKEGEHAQ